MNENITFTCSICGTEHPISERTTFDNEQLCRHCLDAHTLVCSECGGRIWNDDNFGNDFTILCEDCFEEDYSRCQSCGRLIHNDSSYYTESDRGPYCERCYENLENAPIHDYYFKPSPIFHGNGPRFFGVELEIDEAGERNDNAETLLNIANANTENIYCKHDGSLDDGFEIVTHPMSLDYHLHEMPWADVLDEAIHMGYSSHQAGTCGLHIHVSRNAFGDSESWQECCVARVLYLVEKFWDELLKFSRRTTHQLDQWARRYGYKDCPQELMGIAKEGTPHGRYMAVNLENYNTIEFRLWRGTLKLNTLLATLQMVDRICDVAISLSDEQIQQLSWTTFAAGCSEYPELVQYLKERRLYVNDPVDDNGGEV